MKALILLILVVPMTLSATEISPFTAEYDVQFSGLSGEATTVLRQNNDGAFVFENRTRAKGLARLVRPRDVVERSEFEIEMAVVRPVSFDSEDGTRRNKKGTSIDFDWSGMTASSEYEGETHSLELKEGMLDRQLVLIAMMADLANGITKNQYTVIDRNGTKTYEMSVVGRETVDVPAGSFETVKIVRGRSGSSRSSVIWCAPDLGFVTVKMEQLKDNKVIGTLSLTAIS
ncbi:MAG: DUF3108 domain-containing protein [Gammaproteobacteria bacterium]|nr:DUF3108 domain-containing protein [Gammaproteobacteria bacterium]